MKKLIVLFLFLALANPADSADKAGLLASWLGVFASGWQPDKPGWEGGCIKNGVLDVDQFKAFVHQARKYGANGMRIFPYETKWVPSADKMFSPVLWDADKKAWDLNKWNEAYFVALDQLVEICELNHIRVWYSLFDNCQNHTGVGSNRNRAMAPWLNNVQGAADYLKSVPLSKKWVQKILDRYGNRMSYEIGNELCVIQGSTPNDTATWLAQMADAVLRSGVPPESICWGAEPIGSWNGEKFEIDKNKDLITVASRILSRMLDPDNPGKTYNEARTQDRIYCTIHNIGIYPTDKKDETIAVQLWGGAHTRKALLSDDGQSVGHSVMNCEPDGTWRRGNYKETYDTQRYLSANDGGKDWRWIFETLPSNTAPAAWLDNIRAMADAYKNRYGVFPVNYGTPDPVYVEPEPEPLPEPEPEPSSPAAPEKVGILAAIALALLAGLKKIIAALKRLTWQGWLLILIFVAVIVLAIIIF